MASLLPIEVETALLQDPYNIADLHCHNRLGVPSSASTICPARQAGVSPPIEHSTLLYRRLAGKCHPRQRCRGWHFSLPTCNRWFQPTLVFRDRQHTRPDIQLEADVASDEKLSKPGPSRNLEADAQRRKICLVHSSGIAGGRAACRAQLPVQVLEHPWLFVSLDSVGYISYSISCRLSLIGNVACGMFGSQMTSDSASRNVGSSHVSPTFFR